jgi:hypothetical protein
VQNGSGTLLLSGTDNGGVYWGNGTTVMFDLRNQTNIIVRAKTFASNLSTNFYLWLHDWDSAEVTYRFPFSALNTNGFAWLTNDLSTPVFGDATNFNFAHVVAIDLIGDFSSDEQPFALEVDAISTLGPPVVYGPPIGFIVFTNRVDLFWPTGSGSGFMLQSAPTLSGTWTNESGVSVTNTNFVVSKSFADTNRFFRLSKSQTFPLHGGSGKKSADGFRTGVGDSEKETEIEDIAESPWNSSAKSVTPPAITTTVYTNYLDVASFTKRIGWSYYAAGDNGEPTYDEEHTGFRDWSDHSGGSSTDVTTNYAHDHTSNPVHWFRTGIDYLSGYVTTWPTPTNGVQLNVFTGATNAVSYRPATWNEQTAFISTNNGGTFYDDASCVVQSGYRSVLTYTDLHTGDPHSNSSVFVSLEVTCTSVDAINFAGEITQTSPVSFTNISVAGIPLDEEGRVLMQAAARSVTNVTPKVTGGSNYYYSIKIIGHPIISINRTYHPIYHLPGTPPIPKLATLQSNFNAGAIMLHRDDDAKIKDADAPESTNSSSVYQTDDVSHLCEFRISDGPNNTNMLTKPPRLLPVFPKEYAARNYFDLRDETSISNLFRYRGAQIKQVRTITRNNNTNILAMAKEGMKPMNAIFTSRADPGTCIHEWGHSCGIAHRGDTNYLGEWNYGPNLNAIMAATNAANQVEINRYERNKMQLW